MSSSPEQSSGRAQPTGAVLHTLACRQLAQVQAHAAHIAWCTVGQPRSGWQAWPLCPSRVPLTARSMLLPSPVSVTAVTHREVRHTRSNPASPGSRKFCDNWNNTETESWVAQLDMQMVVMRTGMSCCIMVGLKGKLDG